MSPHQSPERPTGGWQTARVLALPYRDRELRDIAEGYLRHEIVTLCGQVRELREWNATGSLLAPVHDALLEAPLLHFLVRYVTEHVHPPIHTRLLQDLACLRECARVEQAFLLAEVKQLRAEGETLHKAGNHGASVEKLGKAMSILGIQ